MDVTGPRLIEASSSTGAAERILAASAAGRPPTAAPAAARAAAGAPDAEPPPRAPGDAPWMPSSILKMGLSAADVDVKFEIGEGSRVTVTMLDRVTGEVLRQIPPRELQDIIDTLQGRGLVVDVAR